MHPVFCRVGSVSAVDLYSARSVLFSRIWTRPHPDLDQFSVFWIWIRSYLDSFTVFGSVFRCKLTNVRFFLDHPKVEIFNHHNILALVNKYLYGYYLSGFWIQIWVFRPDSTFNKTPDPTNCIRILHSG